MKEQFIHIDESGNKRYYQNREMTILHRQDGPAYEHIDGHRAWYLNGNRHRKDGPAVEGADGYRAWFLNGERHREDGGPAIESEHHGYRAWYLNGKKLTKEEHARHTQKEIVYTLDEIADKLGVDVNRLKIRK